MISKPAITSFPIHPVLQARWSPRAFNGEPVSPVLLHRMFEAARWSPSSGNEQPWRYFIGIKGDGVYEKIFETLDKGNKNWVKTAAVIIVSIARTTWKGDPEITNGYALYDVGQSMAHLTFQAASDGLYVHQMAGFDALALSKVLGLDAHYKPLTIAAIGYMGAIDQLPEYQQKREVAERSRQPLEKMVFGTKFGQVADFLQKIPD